MNTRFNARLALVMLGLLILMAAGISLAQEVCEPTLPEGWIVYTVQPDDTLADLAALTVTTVEELQTVNCVEEVEPGQDIFLPVDPGEAAAPYGLALRCQAEGLTTEECRQIAYGSDSGEGLLQRCREEGLETVECYRMVYGTDDANGLLERCRAQEVDDAQCGQIVAGNADLEDHTGLMTRCRAQELTTEECRRLVYGSEEGNGLMERCREEGLESVECHRMVYGTGDANGLMERCRAEGATQAQCQRIVDEDDESGDDVGLLTRCRAEGLTRDECRRMVYGSEDGNGLLERCRAEGLSTEECCRLMRRTYQSAGDGGNGPDSCGHPPDQSPGPGCDDCNPNQPPAQNLPGESGNQGGGRGSSNG